MKKIKVFWTFAAAIKKFPISVLIEIFSLILSK